MFCVHLLVVLFFAEPGYYEDGSFGIRLENVVLVVPAKPKVGIKKVTNSLKNIFTLVLDI